MEKDGETSFEELVKKKCPYYYDLLEIMQDRASSEPKATNYSLQEDDSLSEMSEDEVASVAKTASSGNTSKKSSSTKKRKLLTLMDDGAVKVLKEGNVAMNRRMIELERHNKMLESLEERKLQMEQQRLQGNQWHGKNEELNYKMNLMQRYEEFRNKFGWSDEQILAFYPDMSQVIQAREAGTPRLPPLAIQEQEFAVAIQEQEFANTHEQEFANTHKNGEDY